MNTEDRAEFKAMSEDARRLWFFMAAGADISGNVRNPKGIRRRLGFSDATVVELLESGFVTVIGGVVKLELGCRYNHFTERDGNVYTQYTQFDWDELQRAFGGNIKMT
jgi:hypothetical protein